MKMSRNPVEDTWVEFSPLRAWGCVIPCFWRTVILIFAYSELADSAVHLLGTDFCPVRASSLICSLISNILEICKIEVSSLQNSIIFVTLPWKQTVKRPAFHLSCFSSKSGENVKTREIQPSKPRRRYSCEGFFVPVCSWAYQEQPCEMRSSIWLV